MTVIFCALIIICGVASAFFFVAGSPLGGLVNLAICILAIVALVGRIMAERGLFGSLAKKKDLNNSTISNSSIPQPVSSDADEIKKYKELLDQGAITEEEYEAKKKQILGL